MELKFIEAYNSYEKYIELKLKVQSIRTIKNRFEIQILPYFKDYDIYSLKEIDYLNWQSIINKKNYSYKYKQTLHIAVVTFFNYCMTYYDLNKNIASKVGKFKNNDVVKRKYSFYTYEEFKEFIKYVDELVYKQFFTFMFFTGARPGEAMALKFSDLNHSIISINKTIDGRYDKNTNQRTITSPKSKSSIRDIAIDDKLNIDLINLKEYYKNKYNIIGFDYFIFGGIKPLAPTTINRKQSLACEKSGMKKIRLHDFRHSHATLLFTNKMFINEISRRLGHSDISITLNTYIHTDVEQEKRVINTLNSLRLN